MGRPFEGLLGNTCELRILEYLLPLSGMEFNVTELAEEAGVSRVTAGRVVKKFVEWGLLNVHPGRVPLYSIDAESPIVQRIEDLNNALIEKMLGEEQLDRIHEFLRDRSCGVPQEISAERVWEPRYVSPFEGAIWGGGIAGPAPSYATADSDYETEKPGYFQ
ncbi:winged helix-turn-helix transcriptional regulator [Methanoculleus sp. FWC-SCC1]|uniref:Winged helix-turn-helix transcriptional regulator n=1 Tax=Methanoculleus frigidifontis TaxID=2584085 RepID=A0ABT8M7A9_9EURY|nr:winged helix-turn-helix transcriptional regulator [Methanoculleus sp. FWC-SCC1]